MTSHRNSRTRPPVRAFDDHKSSNRPPSLPTISIADLRAAIQELGDTASRPMVDFLIDGLTAKGFSLSGQALATEILAIGAILKPAQVFGEAYSDQEGGRVDLSD